MTARGEFLLPQLSPFFVHSKCKEYVMSKNMDQAIEAKREQIKSLEPEVETLERAKAILEPNGTSAPRAKRGRPAKDATEKLAEGS
jgi:hypothetical protein